MWFLLGKLILVTLIAQGDFKERKIAVLFLGLLLAINLVDGFVNEDWMYLGEKVLWNTVIIAFIFGVTYAYFKWVKGIDKPSETHLGAGDWMFFLAIVPLFHPVVFIYVFLGMNVIAFLVGAFQVLIKKKKYIIPYAGIAAVLLGGIEILRFFLILDLSVLI